MTELLDAALEVRHDQAGFPAALRTGGGWCRVLEVAAEWRVETDWWRTPVRRDYFRCLLEDGECVELYLDLDGGTWHWSRRHD